MHTKGKWKHTISGAEHRIVLDSDPFMTIARCGCGSEDEANAKHIVHCVNTHDENERKAKQYKEEIHNIRPYADCYKRICEILNIDSNILGYIQSMKDTHDELVEALEKMIKKAEINPCEATECRLHATKEQCIKCLEKANRAIIKDLKQALAKAKGGV